MFMDMDDKTELEGNGGRLERARVPGKQLELLVRAWARRARLALSGPGLWRPERGRLTA